MKIYIEQEDNYIVLSDELAKDNYENYLIRNEAISNAMDKLEEYRMKLEMERKLVNPVMVKKLGVHPNMKSS